MAYRVLALIGAAVGLAIYGAAFFINAPIKVCIDQVTPRLTGSDSWVATAASSSKTWMGIVASRCELTFTTGLHVDDLVVEWGPSFIAIAGLVLAAFALWIRFGLRAEGGE